MSIKYGTRRRDIALDWTEPWLFDRKLAVSTGVFYRDIFFNSDLYDERHAGGEVSLRKPLSENSYGKVGYRLDFAKIHNIDDDASDLIRAEEGDYVDSQLFAEWTLDTRDSFTLPRKGHKFSIGTELGVGGDVETYAFEIGGAQYYTGPLDTIFSLEGIFRTIDTYGSGTVPIFKREFLGGARNLRGYDYREAGSTKDEDGEPLGGKTSAYLTAEVSTPLPGKLGDKVRLATFYDVGTVSSSSWNFDDVYSDIGIGVRLFILPGAPIRLDYGYPLKTDEFTGSSGKFNFQMGWNF
jgi:outer membrane protein insertion porin family